MEKGKQGDDKTEMPETLPTASCVHPENEADNDSTASVSDNPSEEMEKALSDLLYKNLRIPDDRPAPAPVLDELNLMAVARFMKTEQCKNIIVMVGAGISTSAGIPDFRSPNTGIYATLNKYDLPSPECMFDISYFKKNPKPFFKFAKELFPTQFKPTMCHYFLRILCEKGKLLRLYTQNIDTLERVAGIPSDKIVEAHGTFFTSHCMNQRCRKIYDLQWMKERIFSSDESTPCCTACKAVVKPDIVFFGEQLPSRFHDLVDDDFSNCDLLIVIGTSLTVEPFANLIDIVPDATPRLLINNRKCGHGNTIARLLRTQAGFDFDSPKNIRDVLWLGMSDDGCIELAESLGWKDELQSLFSVEHAKLDAVDSSLPTLAGQTSHEGKV